MGFHGPDESAELQKRLEKDGTTELGEEESQALTARMEALDQFFADRIEATYKIEIQFGKARSGWKPFPGALSVFLSGTKLHGGGDEKLYLCPRDDCSGIIYPNERLGATVLCRTCEMMWDENKLVGELLFNLTPQDWARAVYKMFVRLEHKADIYLKYHPEDIRFKAALEMARQRGGEELNKARQTRGLHIYPLKNLIKDTASGAQPYDRFLAFIKA